MVLGDSFTEAHHVDPEKNYVSLLNKYYDDVLFINGGYSGNSIADYLRYHERYEELEPDLYIIQIGLSDVTKDSFDKGHRNYFENKEGRLVLARNEQSEKQSSYYKLATNSQLLRFIKQKYYSKLKNLLSSDPQKEKEEKDYMIEEQVRILKEEFGNNLVVLYIPRVPMIKDGEVVFEESEDIKRSLIGGLSSLDIDFLDTTDDFNNYYNETKQFPFGFDNTQPGTGHLNEVGHEIVAKDIRSILDRGVLAQ